MLNSVDIKKAIYKKRIAYFTIHKTERTRGMVKKRNLKRLLAVVLSFAMAIQPTSMVFAEGENAGGAKSDVIVKIEPENGITITTALDGVLNRNALAEELRSEHVKVTTTLDGGEVQNVDAAKEYVDFVWTKNGETTPLNGQIKDGDTYEVKAIFGENSPYNAIGFGSNSVTVTFRAKVPEVPDSKKTLKITLEDNVEITLQESESYDLKELVKYVTAYNGEADGTGADVKADVIEKLTFTCTNATGDVFTELPNAIGEYKIVAKYNPDTQYEESTSNEVTLKVGGASVGIIKVYTSIADDEKVEDGKPFDESALKVRILK